MISGSLTGHYKNDVAGAVGTVTLDGGDVKLTASITDAALSAGPSLKDLSLSLVKPAAFVIDYSVANKDVKFQFMNTVRVMERPLHFTYTHWKTENRTALDGTLMIDSANKLSANYGLDSGNFRVKYCYSLDGLTTVEPSYDFGSSAWDFAVSRRLLGNDVVRASYESSTKVLGLDWKQMTGSNGSIKVSATMNLAEPYKTPTLRAESSMNFDI